MKILWMFGSALALNVAAWLIVGEFGWHSITIAMALEIAADCFANGKERDKK